MKFSTSLSTLLVLLPLASSALGASIPVRRSDLARRQFGGFRGGGGGGFRGGNDNDDQDNNNDQNQDDQDAAADDAAADDAAADDAAADDAAADDAAADDAAADDAAADDAAADDAAADDAAADDAAADDAAADDAAADDAAADDAAADDAAADEDPQVSLTLDPAVIAPGFAQDGQDPPVDGQVASLTSTNNFINFCLTRPDLPLTDGKQIVTGSCNPAPIGLIPAIGNMPSSKFVNPPNGASLPADTPFTIEMAIENLVTGNFVNAQENYFAAPQQLLDGVIQGHSHVVVELLDGLDQTTPTDPQVFAFFKGLNAAAEGGILTADVDDGLPAGDYRLCSINTSSNHQPVIVPVAQHGALDDCVYFTLEDAAAAAADDAAADDAAADDAAADDAAADDAAADDAAADDAAADDAAADDAAADEEQQA